MNKHIKSFRYMAAGSLCMIGVFLAAKTDESSSEQALSDKVLAEKHLEDRGFQIPERDNNLPNVLLYGDSITGHYYPYVATALKGKANVYTMPPHEDWDSSNLIPYMTEAKEAGDGPCCLALTGENPKVPDLVFKCSLTCESMGSLFEDLNCFDS